MLIARYLNDGFGYFRDVLGVLTKAGLARDARRGLADYVLDDIKAPAGAEAEALGEFARRLTGEVENAQD